MRIQNRWPLRGTLFLWGVLAASFTSSPAHAQADPDSVKLRNDCRLAEQVLFKGHPEPHRAEALATIGLCGAEATPVLIQIWGTELQDREEIMALVVATRGLYADGLADRIFSVLGDVSAPRDMRLASIMVLVTWADPRAVPSFRNLRHHGEADIGFRRWRTDHAVPVSGRESLAPGFMDRLRASLEAVRGGDPDEEMRGAAGLTLASPPLG